MVVECEECQNFLRLLGITQPATDEQLKAAYRDYVRVWHPDRFDSDARLRARAEEETKRINAAYDHLCNHKESEPCRNEEPIPWPESAERPDAAPWQEVKHQHEPEASQRMENHGTQSGSENPAWRWIKVCLRAVWRVFAIALMLSFGALLLLYLVFKAIKYFDNRDRGHKGDLSASLNAWVTELYVAKFLGLPLLVVRALMFISAVALVGVGFAGGMVWSFLAPHPLIIIYSAVIASLGCMCWALVAEYDFEFAVAHSKDAPRTAAWVMGLIVTLGSVGVAAYVLAGASARNTSLKSDMSVASTSVDSNAMKETSPSPVLPASSITSEATPIPNTQPNSSPIDNTSQNVQDPKESKQLNTEGPHMSSVATSDDEVAAKQQATAQHYAPPSGLVPAQGTSQTSSGQEASRYADMVQRRIQHSWLVLKAEPETPKGTHIVLGFIIRADGSITDVEIEKSSGSPQWDRDCKDVARLRLSPPPSSFINGHFTASCDY
jgi:outer membrane biosynthesis protein TonB